MNSIREALPNFHGIRRRMEVFLRHEGVTFIDDFAHHPTAIRETIRAAKSVYDGRILVLLEPRSNTMVTNRFQSDIAASLRDADAVWIGAIHRQERIPPELRLDRDALVEHLCSQGISARAFDTPGEIVHSVTGDLREGDCVLILSNGSFGGYIRCSVNSWDTRMSEDNNQKSEDIQGSMKLSCQQCGGSFDFSENEQRFFAEMGFVTPRYCPTCRKNRKKTLY